MKTTLKLAAILFTICGGVEAQVSPTATSGSSTLRPNANLQYAFRYSQVAQFWSGYTTEQASTASGTLDYGNLNARRPFNIEYAGGYSWTLSGPAYQTGQFHRLYLSQGAVGRTWKVNVDDNVSYLPEAPTTGFSGVPGTGEPIGEPNPGAPSSQTILTQNTSVVDNSLSGNVDHNLTNATDLRAGGNWELMRFPNGDGYDTNSVMAEVTVNRRINGRNSLAGDYRFSQYSYPGNTVTFGTNSGLFGFQRRWTKNLSTNIEAGPQWINSSDSSVVPSSTNVAVVAALSYQLRYTYAGLSYSRGSNGGAGYLFGGEIDTVAGNLSRQFGQNFSLGFTGAYDRTSGLNSNGVTNGMYGGAEATWRINRTLIMFANYTGTSQVSTSALQTGALNQTVHVIGFGLGYSPRITRVR